MSYVVSFLERCLLRKHAAQVFTPSGQLLSLVVGRVNEHKLYLMSQNKHKTHFEADCFFETEEKLFSK